MVDISKLMDFTRRTQKALQDAISKGDAAEVKRLEPLITRANQLGTKAVESQTKPLNPHTYGDGIEMRKEGTARPADPLYPEYDPLNEAGDPDRPPEGFGIPKPKVKLDHALGLEMPSNYQMGDIPPELAAAPRAVRFPKSNKSVKPQAPIIGAPATAMDFVANPTMERPSAEVIPDFIKNPKPIKEGEDLVDLSIFSPKPKTSNFSGYTIPVEGEKSGEVESPAESKIANFPFLKDSYPGKPKEDGSPMEGATKDLDIANPKIGEALDAMIKDAEGKKASEMAAREKAVLEEVKKKYGEKPDAFTWENLAVLLLMGAPRAYNKFLSEKKDYEKGTAREFELFDTRKRQKDLDAQAADFKKQTLDVMRQNANVKANDAVSKFTLEKYKQDRTDNRAKDANMKAIVNTFLGGAGRQLDDDGISRMLSVAKSLGIYEDMLSYMKANGIGDVEGNE